MILIIIAIIGGFSGGCIFGYILAHLFRKVGDYAGIMKIIQEENRLLYSLELYDSPEVLRDKREIVFKVERSDESSNRK